MSLKSAIAKQHVQRIYTAVCARLCVRVCV